MKTKSLKRSLGSMALAFESFVVFFAMLAAFGLRLADGVTVWTIGLSISIIMILLPGVLGKKGSYAVGWALQVLVLGISIFTIAYSPLGYGYLVFSIIFIGIWAWAMIAGSTVDAANRVLQSQTNEQNGIEENK
jgi:phosphoglycerol transferase MdoB-like AlkP superfamily enzyme